MAADERAGMPAQQKARDEASWLSILDESLAEASAEAAKEGVSHALAFLVPAVLASPMAAFAVTAVKLLFIRLDQSSRKIADDTKAILDEPFMTAARTLREVAAVDIQSPSEAEEAKRQLATAYDNLSRALSYAEKRDSQRRTLVRVVQCATAAVMPGGRPFAVAILRELREEVASRRASAAQMQEQAHAMEPEISQAVAELKLNRRYPGPLSMRIDAAAQTIADSNEVSRLQSRQTELVRAAEQALRDCERLTKICDVIEGALTGR